MISGCSIVTGKIPCYKNLPISLHSDAGQRTIKSGSGDKGWVVTSIIVDSFEHHDIRIVFSASGYYFIVMLERKNCKIAVCFAQILKCFVPVAIGIDAQQAAGR